jgi:hypothetical protein
VLCARCDAVHPAACATQPRTERRLYVPSSCAATRKVYHNKTFAECCEACYLDVQEGEEGMCRTWEVPGYPENNTCYLYAGFSIQMTYSEPGKDGYTGRGARRHDSYPPPPPPPAPCSSPQSLMPVKWPKFSESNDQNIRLDLCNVTVEDELKKDICVFWDRCESQPTCCCATALRMHRLVD